MAHRQHHVVAQREQFLVVLVALFKLQLVLMPLFEVTMQEPEENHSQDEGGKPEQHNQPYRLFLVIHQMG